MHTTYLIDPTKQTVTPLERKEGDYRSIAPTLNASVFDCVRLSNLDPETETYVAMYVDDEGRLTYPNPNGYFQLIKPDGTLTCFYAGKAIIHGVDKTGSECAVPLTLEQVAKTVHFPPIAPTAEEVEPRFTFTTF